jgi:sugar O-acyltransferase (sialic acid O-acetyltransferase NeuD family)
MLGAGGHAKVLLEVLRLCNRPVVGVTNRGAEGKGQLFCGVPMLGGDEALAGFSPDQVELVNGVGFAHDATARANAFMRGQSAGFRFVTLVHPGAIVAAGVELGEGAQIMAGAVVQPGTVIGTNAIINTRASVDHDCRIGAHAHVAPGAVLCGGVEVGEGSLVGAGATIVPGVRVGCRSTIGAGAVCRQNVLDAEVMVGVPARRVASGKK